MMGSKIQKAAGMVLINSRKNDVSDIHIEPREDGYKIRVRKDGNAKFMSMLKNQVSISGLFKKYGPNGHS